MHFILLSFISRDKIARIICKKYYADAKTKRLLPLKLSKERTGNLLVTTIWNLLPGAL
jgi:hypothetical protein